MDRLSFAFGAEQSSEINPPPRNKGMHLKYLDEQCILLCFILQESESLFSLLLSTDSKGSAQSSGAPDELMNHVSRRLHRELSRFFNLLLQRLKNTADRLHHQHFKSVRRK